MKIVGLTGGIGSGKSYCAKIFKWFGIRIYNADTKAKWLMINDTQLILQLKDLLGSESYSKDGELNRQYIADIIFKDPEMLSKMNQLIHPAVRADFFEWCGRHLSEPYIIQESAILMETGAYQFFDYIILVDAPIDIRLKRTMARDNMKKEDVESRMSNQWPSDKTRPLADFIIENDESTSVMRQVYNIHRTLLKANSTEEE